MTDSFIGVCALTIGAMVIILPLKELKKEYFNIAISSLGILVVFLALKNVYPIMLFINTIYDDTFSVYFQTMVKVLGITFISNLTSELAGDLGMSSVSGKVNFAGRVAVLLVSMPVFENLFDLVVAFS